MRIMTVAPMALVLVLALPAPVALAAPARGTATMSEGVIPTSGSGTSAAKARNRTARSRKSQPGVGVVTSGAARRRQGTILRFSVLSQSKNPSLVTSGTSITKPRFFAGEQHEAVRAPAQKLSDRWDVR